MNKQEKEDLQRIKGSLYEFPESLMAQHILCKDLEALVKLIEKCTKK